MRTAIIVVLFLVAACSNDPTPVTPGSPIWITCAGGGYCDSRDSVCGEKGHACGEEDCCFTGDNGRAFGGKRHQTKVPPP